VTDWNHIVEQCGRRLFVLAQRILGNAADAEDVVQDVLVEACRVADVETVANWPGLLHRLTTHRSLDRLRQRRPVEGLGAETAGGEAEPHEIAVANELAARLREAINRLPRQQAAAFCLRYFEDLSYDEIAAALAIDNGAAATAIYKARQRLKLLLDMTAKEPLP
jgi:RNA polymerase sigma-70 factor (ECF subfamily)